MLAIALSATAWAVLAGAALILVAVATVFGLAQDRSDLKAHRQKWRDSQNQIKRR